MAIIDRRRYPRYLADINARCFRIAKNGTSEKHMAKVKGCIGEKDGEVILASKVTDISKGGIFLETVKEFPVNTILTVELVLPEGNEIVSTAGVVKWTTPIKNNPPYTVGLGINFIYMKKEDWNRIEKYLVRLKPYVLS